MGSKSWSMPTTVKRYVISDVFLRNGLLKAYGYRIQDWYYERLAYPYVDDAS